MVLLDAAGEDVPLRAGDVTYDIRGSGSKSRGTCDGEGTFGATISVGTLLARLKVTSGEARYAIQLRAPGPVLGGVTPEPWSSGTSTHALPGGEP